MGENFELSEKLNGFRFISSKTPTTISFRAEVWFDFNNSDLEILQAYQKIFQTMFEEIGYEHGFSQVNFVNMKGDEKKDKKDYKKDDKKSDPAEPSK